MSMRPDNLLNTCLLLFYTLMFACIHGKDEEKKPCDVALVVPQGSTRRVALNRSLTVHCPVLSCGESVSVAWCKQLDRCELVYPTEDVEMSQSEKGEGKVMAYLFFKRISVQDAGLYRCYVDGYKSEQISHIINISVSALNHEIENLDDDHSGDIHPPADDADISWLPFFFICLVIVLAFGVMIMFPFFRHYCQKRNLTFGQTNMQETTIRTIPDLPAKSAPTNFLQPYQPIFLSDYHSPSMTGMLTSQPNMVTEANQPANSVLYARINHRQSELMTVTGPHAATAQSRNAQYEAAYHY